MKRRMEKARTIGTQASSKPFQPHCNRNHPELRETMACTENTRKSLTD
jgi:hypothetical protein